VAAGGFHSLFVKLDGTLWAMGWNSAGQLGDGTTTDRSSPVQVASGVSAVAAGGSVGGGHSLFIKADGRLWAMGSNSSGQLGDGSTTSRSSPIEVASGVSAVAAGNGHSLLVTTDGPLWAVGYNSDGQLGDGTTTDRNMPVQVASRIRAPALLRVLVLNSFADWQQYQFRPTEIFAGSALALGDPDHDGLTNLMEYALGSDPQTFTGVEAALSEDDDEWIFTYSRPAARTDVTYLVEYSTDLASWTSEGVAHERVATGSIEIWQGAVPNSVGNTVFFRLRITQVPPP
jgi:hypothetical protein